MCPNTYFPSRFATLALFSSLVMFGCAWPWPSATEDTAGLGKSEIARILRTKCCAGFEELIARDIQVALDRAGKNGSSREAAESVGFTCDNPPSKTCRYRGEMTYQVHGAPKENQDAQKVHIVSYSILLSSHDHTDDVRVQQQTMVAPSSKP